MGGVAVLAARAEPFPQRTFRKPCRGVRHTYDHFESVRPELVQNEALGAKDPSMFPAKLIRGAADMDAISKPAKNRKSKRRRFAFVENGEIDKQASFRVCA